VVSRLLLYVDPSHLAASPLDLGLSEWSLHTARKVSAAQEHVASRRFHVGLASIGSAEGAVLAELQGLLASSTHMEWIALLPNNPALRLQLAQFICTNFFDYHTMPPDTARLSASLGHALGMAKLREAGLGTIFSAPHNSEMIGSSPQMKEVFRAIVKLASADAPVLITGESGTGKELAALAIHKCSRRAHAPFVAVNCGALPRNLIQSELFGHEKGAFTDAHARRIGRIESAVGGTIFLDEISDLPLDLQVNLLRFLQEKTIERVGNPQPIPVDVRVIAASNIALEKALQTGQFRADLYYRLSVLNLTIPPLREREGDVELLAQFFLRKFSSTERTRVKGFSRQALDSLNAYLWPGNVRELINRVRRATVMCEGRLISAIDLGLEKRQRTGPTVTLEETRATAEQQAISYALRRNSNNITQAASELGVSRMTLYRLMQRHHLLKTASAYTEAIARRAAKEWHE